MTKSIIIFLKKYFLSQKWYIKINIKNLPIELHNFNHLNIFFNHNNLIKNRIITKNYFKKNQNPKKNIYYNSFDWLLSAKIIGGPESLYFSKKQIKLWHSENFPIKSSFWSNVLCAKRLINLIYAYDFYAISTNESDKKIFQYIVYKHYIINKIYIKNLPTDKLSIESSKANLLLELLYEKNIIDSIEVIKKQLIEHIDTNGFHKSYNPVVQAEYINNLIEIKNILLFFKIKVFEEINFQIANMTSVLNNLFHKDTTLALFNGSHNIFNKDILTLIKQKKDIKEKKLFFIKNGLAIYSDREKKVFFDVVKPTNNYINNKLHSGTLSFEFSAKKEKIITNCGSINKIYDDKPNYLRFSAAHSTLILNNTNISELDYKRSYTRIPKNINYQHKEEENQLTLICSHDGYKENYKKIIKRKLTISKMKNTIFGQDSIIPIKLSSKKILFNIRFHLMPDSQSSLTNSKKKVIIKTKNSNTWVFETENKLEIDESIFIDLNDKIQQSKQIVINGFVEDSIKVIKWSIKEL